MTMGKLIIGGISKSGADAQAPQPSKFRMYSSIPSSAASGSHHSQRKEPESCSFESFDMMTPPFVSPGPGRRYNQ